MNPKPTVTLTPGEMLRVDEVAHDIGIDPEILLADLRGTLREHYRSFGVNAFSCEYSAKTGHVIFANSNIGWLQGRVVALKIQPKIPGINIGKCLGMAQVVKNGPATFSHVSKITALISKDIEYSAIEYIAFTFLDSLYTVIQNGLARRFDEVILSTHESSGAIQIQEWISCGKTPPPVKSLTEPSIDILPNQILCAAVCRCIDFCRSPKLKLSLVHCREQLKAAKPDALADFDIDSVLLHRFNLPRKDYSRALSFALAILKGCQIGEGAADVLPAFTIDLDQLFEQFCTTVLGQLLKPQKFLVEAQPEHCHSVDPEYIGVICPDVVVTNLSTKKRLIVDLKNKYSAKGTETTFYASNPDLFQMSYYINTLEADCGFLVYPASKSRSSFPIKGSESDKAYAEKVAAFEARSCVYRRKFFPVSANPQHIHSYHIDLSGSMANTIKSLASLAFYIEYLTDKK